LTNDNNADSFELFNFFSCKYINLEDLKNVEFDEEHNLLEWFTDIDLAFCEIKQPLNLNCITHELKYDNNVLVPAKLPKLRILECCVKEINKEDKYRIYGVIKNCEVSSRLERTNALHCDITLNEITEDQITMDYPSVKLEEWSTLSGSLIFSDDGYCVGMLTSVVEENNLIHGIPFRIIFKIIDFVEDNKHVFDFNNLPLKTANG
jgi:hypothetical protein